ncbi:MAG: thiamine phosphate synthase [Parvularculaceae bacterium]|nr:thiamine phosphate synthase [Parvularculaceae bacterium]
MVGIRNNRHQFLRERAGRLAAAAQTLKRASGAPAPFSLAFLTDRRRIARPELVIRVLPAGAAVVYRDYDDPARTARAAALAALCRQRGVLFVVAGDFGLAARCRADGLHLPSAMATKVSRPISFDGIVTAAAHSARELAEARAIGAQAVFLSPVFATQSHLGGACLGPARFRALAASSTIPVIALGGVDEANAGRLAGAAAGLGAIGAFAPR